MMQQHLKCSYFFLKSVHEFALGAKNFQGNLQNG
jgi:hypothetical protein